LPEEIAAPGRLTLVFTLRKYRRQDFKRLLEIDQTCFAEGIAYDRDELGYFISLPASLTLVGEQHRKIHGFIVAERFRERRTARSMGRIITIDVIPESQHSGLGTLLLTSAEAELKQLGCEYMSLEVAVDNQSALRFYKKHGYSVLKILPHYYMDSLDGLMMGKKLTGSGDRVIE
jgi:ribosomal-protein-alanine N-acetyltransferase